VQESVVLVVVLQTQVANNGDDMRISEGTVSLENECVILLAVDAIVCFMFGNFFFWLKIFRT